MIVMGCMDLDHAFRTDQPQAPTSESSRDDKLDFERWKRSNRMSLMIMMRTIPEDLRGAITESMSAKKFLEEVEKSFAKNEKAETSTLLSELVTLKFNGKGNIREHIMKMSNICSKLKALGLNLPDDFTVHMVLLSLPPQYGQFKVSYSCQKEKWTLSELISHCPDEAERLKRDKTESAHLATTPKFKKRKATKLAAVAEASTIKKQKKSKEKKS
ncbi:unnamed protein product [Victoria cruziana]